jgi:hypothetical protein
MAQYTIHINAPGCLPDNEPEVYDTLKAVIAEVQAMYTHDLDEWLVEGNLEYRPQWRKLCAVSRIRSYDFEREYDSVTLMADANGYYRVSIARLPDDYESE